MSMHPDMVWQEMVREVLSVGDHDGKSARRMPSWLVQFASTPLVSARATAWRNALRELEWLMYGGGRLEFLHPAARHWWARWAQLGDPIPGVAWPDLEPHVVALVAHPASRRNIFTTWSAGPRPVPRNDLVAQLATSRGEVELFVYQAQTDLGRGAMHNWVQQWALGLWFASRAGLPFKGLRWFGGVLHAYDAHADVLRKAAGVKRELIPPTPQLRYSPSEERFRAADFSLEGAYAPVVRDPLEHV